MTAYSWHAVLMTAYSWYPVLMATYHMHAVSSIKSIQSTQFEQLTRTSQCLFNLTFVINHYFKIDRFACEEGNLQEFRGYWTRPKADS